MAAALALPGAALGDQRYTISGSDRYQIGSADLHTNITYSGTQSLTVRRAGKQKQFSAEAKYFRSDETGRISSRASFAQVMTPQGELQDSRDDDPDYLTVLNQPFAIELDPETLQELQNLKTRVPFEFPARVMGGTLRGFLRRGPDGRIAAQPAIAITFDATGPMEGPLPDRAAMTMRGTMHMKGTAYYALHGEAILLALRETLTISGTIVSGTRHSPVRITYERSIEADQSPPAKAEASSH